MPILVPHLYASFIKACPFRHLQSKYCCFFSLIIMSAPRKAATPIPWMTRSITLHVKSHNYTLLFLVPLAKGSHGASAQGGPFSVIDVGSVFIFCFCSQLRGMCPTIKRLHFWWHVTPD